MTYSHVSWLLAVVCAQIPRTSSGLMRIFLLGVNFFRGKTTKRMRRHRARLRAAEDMTTLKDRVSGHVALRSTSAHLACTSF